MFIDPDKIVLLSGILLSLFIIKSCSEESISLQNDTQILAYLSSNNLTAEQTDNGLYYIVSKYGTVDTSRIDSVPNSRSFMQVHLTGSLLDGSIFYDTQVSDPILADLSSTNLIDGLKTGLQFFTRGGSGILIIPSSLAYSSAGVSTTDIPIPPDVPIRYDVEVIDFYNSEEAYNDTILNSYFKTNSIVSDTSLNGTYVNYQNIGTSDVLPTSESTVLMRYSVATLSGVPFYSSLDNSVPDTLNLNSQFIGLQEGLSLCPEGTTATIYVPSQSALSSRSNDSIPAYSQLIYEVVLESIL